ncbi:MAG: inorganic diphosphatase [Desulfuromonas sp.]|uniref:putative manganese-dependent inorganic diphosphatase n=1 Tax=Desulfuromonas sp. TaxID=892 RepID=UPI000CB5419E|nr:putative manganese-dependent inorganic diphosphatase [Desulfuromonas sp.]PLX86159.1 MAG: inorganic diphosphatase [Desulfuromonas sp.]
MRSETVYVVGHRNPDTDSICSAMAYARLRQRQGAEHVRPARAGNLNRQTEFVLGELSLPVPPLLVDVHPRVRDVITEHVVTIPAGAPLSLAMELFHLHDIRQLPVVDDDARPVGLLVLKRMTEFVLVPRRQDEIRRVLASPRSIRACLQARAPIEHEPEAVEELNLYVGAMASGTFRQKIQGRDPRSMVLLTGDRENIQREAVEIGVRVLVVTGGLPVSEEILETARQRGVTVLTTPFDTATSAWLTRLATPVGKLVKNDFIAVGLGERVDDLRLKLLHGTDPGAIVLDGDGRVAGIATKSNLLAPSPVKLILVDHNELSQAVPGADKVEILEVVDHHRLGNFHTDQPIRFINQPLGSTCTVVATLYRAAGIDPEPAVAGLLLAGLLSDTVILKSPTTGELDRETARWLGELSGYDPEEFGRRLFQAGSALAAYPSRRDLVLSDFKEFAAGQTPFGVGQVEVVSFGEFLELKDEIEAALAAVKEEKRLAAAALLVTDIVQETSLLLALGSKELPYVIGYPQVGESLYELKGVLSRKKQLVPHLLKVLKG